MVYVYIKGMKNVIWQTDDGVKTEFEKEYIMEVLLKGMVYEVIYDGGRCEVVKDESLIIYSCDESEVTEKFREYLTKFDRLGYRYYLLHLSNENLNHNFDYYINAVHVFRGYYDYRIKMDNVSVIPIGFKSLYFNRDRGNFDSVYGKKYIWSFIGQMKSDREEMIFEMAGIEPHFKYFTKEWNCSSAMSVDSVIEVYKKTIFVPCPMGWINPDSFRINEALEWGCIPIVKRYNGEDYYKYVYGDHPFILVNEWSDACDIVNNLCLDMVKLEQIRKETYDWYDRFKLKLQQNIRRIVL